MVAVMVAMFLLLWAPRKEWSSLFRVKATSNLAVDVNSGYEKVNISYRIHTLLSSTKS